MATAKQPRILIVGSDPDAGAELTRAVEGFGHRAVWARDMGRTIEELRGEWADLVVLDAATATIGAAGAFARRAGFSDIPVILMSAMAEIPERPPYPCLCKPFRLEEMRELVERELRGSFVIAREPHHRPVTATTAPPGRPETAASAGKHGLS